LNRAADDPKRLGHPSERAAIDAPSSADDSRVSFFHFDRTRELFEVDRVCRETTGESWSE
jgi:hypothetical protein